MFKWGIIGTGGIAKAFANDITHLKAHEITAVLSRNIKTAQKFSHSINGCLEYDDLDLFLQDDSLDAIYVATPNTLHCSQTIAALEVKKPVLCEKPFSISSDESQLMIRASKKHSTTLLDGMWMRYLPHIQKLKEILKENRIGDIQSIFACHGQNLQWSKNPRLWTRELGGGALLDLGIYVISFCHMIVGVPEKIFASSIFTDNQVDAKTNMIFQYNNGIVANLSCSMYDTQPNRAVITGTKGYIEIDPTFYAPTSMKLFTNENKTINFENKYRGHGLREQAIEMEYCVRNNLIESPKMRHHETLEVIGIMDKVRAEIGLTFN
ncbi:MAG: Gfo/Idh/MocA family protein [Candidatus Neomarinimicrobiota bacterium]